MIKKIRNKNRTNTLLTFINQYELYFILKIKMELAADSSLRNELFLAIFVIKSAVVICTSGPRTKPTRGRAVFRQIKLVMDTNQVYL
jgi:hypothetical protein